MKRPNNNQTLLDSKEITDIFPVQHARRLVFQSLNCFHFACISEHLDYDQPNILNSWEYENGPHAVKNKALMKDNLPTTLLSFFPCAMLNDVIWVHVVYGKWRLTTK